MKSLADGSSFCGHPTNGFVRQKDYMCLQKATVCCREIWVSRERHMGVHNAPSPLFIIFQCPPEYFTRYNGDRVVSASVNRREGDESAIDENMPYVSLTCRDELVARDAVAGVCFV